MNTSSWIVNLLFIPLPANLKGPRRRHYNYYDGVCAYINTTVGLPKQNRTAIQDASGSYNTILLFHPNVYTDDRVTASPK